LSFYGDPALYIAGPEATAEHVQEIRVQLGLDKPLHEQLLPFLLDLLQGHLGFSTRTGSRLLQLRSSV